MPPPSRALLPAALALLIAAVAPPPAADGQGPSPGLYVVGIDGSGLARLVPGQAFAPAWSPDGTRIAFSGYAGNGSDGIAMVNANGSGLTDLTAGYAEEFGPAWSPDGTKVAFAACAGPCDAPPSSRTSTW